MCLGWLDAYAHFPPQDVSKLLMSQSHIGAKNVNFQMKKYIFKRKADGTHIINLHKTWEKIVLAARLIVAIENPKDVCAISGATFGQRAVLKFATHVGATPIAGKYCFFVFEAANREGAKPATCWAKQRKKTAEKKGSMYVSGCVASKLRSAVRAWVCCVFVFCACRLLKLRAGRYTPGTFTNQIQKAFQEPRLLIVTDPIVDHQPITEASYVNIPVIAFANTDSPLRCVSFSSLVSFGCIACFLRVFVLL